MSDLETIASWLAGEWSNREQAMAEPVWFVPVRLWYRPLPDLFGEGIGFFTEQMSEHLRQPYRTRVLQLLDGPLRLENYRLKDQSAWAGAACAPERLSALTSADCQFLPGCTITLEPSNGSFVGRMSSESRCRLAPDDSGYIEIAFTLREREFDTLDRGFDGEGVQTWGSRSGPYCYRKLS